MHIHYRNIMWCIDIRDLAFPQIWGQNNSSPFQSYSSSNLQCCYPLPLDSGVLSDLTYHILHFSHTQILNSVPAARQHVKILFEPAGHCT